MLSREEPAHIAQKTGNVHRIEKNNQIGGEIS